MALVKWDPFRDMDDFFERFNRFWSLPARVSEEASEATAWIPAVDISETETEYQIKAEIPEVKKKDVKISVDEGILTIQGERKHEKEDKKKKSRLLEQKYCPLTICGQ